jgi:hypothetical protein
VEKAERLFSRLGICQAGKIAGRKSFSFSAE